MHASLHLTFDGCCEQAFRFYERVLGGRIGLLLHHRDSPGVAQAAASPDKIVHGNITIGSTTLQGADVTPEQYVKPQGFYVLLDVDDAATAERVFGELATGGVVHMPLQRTFWSPAFGCVVDRFGVPWEVSAPGR